MRYEETTRNADELPAKAVVSRLTKYLSDANWYFINPNSLDWVAHDDNAYHIVVEKVGLVMSNQNDPNIRAFTADVGSIIYHDKGRNTFSLLNKDFFVNHVLQP